MLWNMIHACPNKHKTALKMVNRTLLGLSLSLCPAMSLITHQFHVTQKYPTVQPLLSKLVKEQSAATLQRYKVGIHLV